MKRTNPPWWVDMIVVLIVTVAAVIVGGGIPISVKSPAWLPCSVGFMVAIVVVVWFWINFKFSEWLGNRGKKPSQPPPRPATHRTRLLGRRIEGRFGPISPRDGSIAAYMADAAPTDAPGMRAYRVYCNTSLQPGRCPRGLYYPDGRCPDLDTCVFLNYSPMSEDS